MRSDGDNVLQDDCIFQLHAFAHGFVFAKNTSSTEVSEDHNVMERMDGSTSNISVLDSYLEGIFEKAAVNSVKNFKHRYILDRKPKTIQGAQNFNRFFG